MSGPEVVQIACTLLPILWAVYRSARKTREQMSMRLQRVELKVLDVHRRQHFHEQDRHAHRRPGT
jgi:hypothetical protein